MITHKFSDHRQSPDTEILILGTFHPNVATGADFYYGRSHNYLWTLLPGCFQLPSLKGASPLEKEAFMLSYAIDFTDIIQTLDGVPEDKATNYKDTFIDTYISEWYPVETLIDSMSSLRAVYFTRKTFQGIPNIAQRILEIEHHCQQNDIRFGLLKTPSRFANQAKLNAWKQVMGIE